MPRQLDLHEENLLPSPSLQEVLQRSAWLAEFECCDDYGMSDPLMFDWNIDGLLDKHYGKNKSIETAE